MRRDSWRYPDILTVISTKARPLNQTLTHGETLSFLHILGNYVTGNETV